MPSLKLILFGIGLFFKKLWIDKGKDFQT